MHRRKAEQTEALALEPASQVRDVPLEELHGAAVVAERVVSMPHGLLATTRRGASRRSAISRAALARRRGRVCSPSMR